MNNNEFNLKTFCQDFKNDNILLPDFQRNFKWKDVEKQQMLVSSVLAKIPIGSILLLEGKSKDFKAKSIGIKPKAKTHDIAEDKDVRFLIDGQQRMTVLVNAFSNNVFLQNGYTEKDVENSLKNRFFLKLDYSGRDIDELRNNDLFGLKQLSFPYASQEKQIPDFTTNEVIDYITVVSNSDKDYSKIDPRNDYASFISNASIDLINFCKSNSSSGSDCYLIPLFALCDGNYANNPIKDIISDVKRRVVKRYQDSIDDPSFEEYSYYPLTKTEITQLNSFDGSQRIELYKRMLEAKGETWESNFLKYIDCCITELNLAEIVVPNGQRGRAINIYEMLNKGGVSLSVYDLVIASVAKKIIDNTPFDKLVRKEIEKEIIKPVQDDYATSTFNSIKWNAQDYMEIIKNDDSISSKYINILLNLIALNRTINRTTKLEANVNHIKRSFILDLPPEHILDVYKKCCIAINRALYILQTRCGLLNINSLNYEHVLLIMSFFLEDDEIYNAEHKVNYLCAWYWLVNFSGEFNESQSQKMVDNMNCLIRYFYSNDQDNVTQVYKKKLDDVFNNSTYSSSDLLLLKNARYGVYPKKHLIDLICQFVISDGKCVDLVDQNIKIRAWDKSLTLEKHHILPLGSYTSYSEMTKGIRNSKDKIVNSPVNYMYITDSSNKKISSDSLQTYTKKIFLDDVSPADRKDILDAHLLKDMYIHMGAVDFSTVTFDDNFVSVLLSQRFDNIKQVVKKYIKENMGLI